MASAPRPELRFGLCYDFRNPPDSALSTPALYAQVLEQIVLAEHLGFDHVWFTEHHFVADGYLPSWVPVAAAAAARTERLRFSTDVCLLPFQHPLRLAEDLAVLDNLSGGRVEIGLGMGYAPHEFRGFGLPVSRRVSLMEEGLEVLERCFRGERFDFAGRRWRFEDVEIAPRYVQPGGPPLWIAAMSEAGAERAARFGAHFLPQGPRAVLERWRRVLAARGVDPATRRVGIIRGVLVTDDPERDWPAVREAERYRMQLYERFFRESGQRWGEDGERIPQSWIVGDAQHCIAELRAFLDEFGITDLVSWGAPPGLAPAQMQQSLERLAREVLPALRS